jgi:hypothetical protein
VIALALCGGLAYFYWHESGTSGTKVPEHLGGAASSSPAVHRSRSSASASAITNANQPAAVAKASATADTDDSDKHAIIQQIRATLISDPEFAEELIREDRERFPDGPDADERDASLISALYNQRRMYDAQLEALNYYEQHPDGQFTDYVMRETRVRPPPRRAKP